MTKPMRVLHFTTHNEDCGIGKYQEQFLSAMQKDATAERLYNEVFSYSPNKTKVMQPKELSSVIDELKEKLKSFDALHIQHELSFFKHRELQQVIDAAKSLGKKVIVTVHTAPNAQYKKPSRVGIGPRSLVRYAKDIKAAREFRLRYVVPLFKADLVLVHNQATRDNLVEHGVDADRITNIHIPVPIVNERVSSDEIKTALSYKKGDIIFASVGFLSRMKGIDQAIRALNYLPSNFKLAIVGGVHPDGGGEVVLDDLCDMIVQNNLKDRVYITGYVESDVNLNALISECDVCVYPYDTVYYSYVSSAALNNAFANRKPAVVYPTKSFVEISASDDAVVVTKSANYYELARSLQSIDIPKYIDKSADYAKRYSYSNEAKKLVDIYENLLLK